jgi:hypothetical protein
MARLDELEWDLELRTTALAEAQAQEISPRDNQDKLMEFFELRWHL